MLIFKQQLKIVLMGKTNISHVLYFSEEDSYEEYFYCVKIKACVTLIQTQDHTNGALSNLKKKPIEQQMLLI